MDGAKRQLSVNESLSNNRKKLLLDNENLSITCFENLSNEIYYEIFDYLDGYDIHQAFSNLNIRFQQLITSSSCLLKFSVHNNDDESKLDMEHYCRDIIIPNKHRIISLHLSDSIVINEFFAFCILDETFGRLECVHLIGVSKSDLIVNLFDLKALPSLFVLKVHLKNYNYVSADLSEIYRIILRLPFLKYNSLMCEEYTLNTMLPLAFNHRFSTIEYLVMRHKCTLKKLMSILQHTPQLYHLTCRELSESYDSVENEISAMLPKLTSLRIWKCSVKFREFKKFVEKTCSQLKVLHIWGVMDENSVDPNQWKQLILQSMPQLHRLDLSCYIATNDYYTNIDSFARLSSSQFWIERGWFLEVEIQSEGIMYSINSKRETWFNFNENMEITTYSNQNIYHDCTQHNIGSTQQKTECYSPIKLTIGDVDTIELEQSFIEKFNPILQAIQFTTLYVSHSSDLSIGDFIKIIRLLPNLDSLRVSYLSIEDLNSLSVEDTLNLHLVSISNKITRVWQPMLFDLTKFLIDLCPRMKYLELDEVNKKNLKKIVRFILMKSCPNIRDLHSICFHLNEANDKMIFDLEKMIESEKLLLNYNIKRKCNDILLQWKLHS